MSSKVFTILLHYGGTVGVIILMALLCWLLNSWLGDLMPLITTLGAGSHDGGPFGIFSFSIATSTDVASTSRQ